MPCGLPILMMPGAKVCASLLLSFAVIPQLSLLNVLISLGTCCGGTSAPLSIVTPSAWALGPPKTLGHQ